MGCPPEPNETVGEGTRRVFRIVSSRYPPFDGGGAHRFGSRWLDPGRLVVHAASSYALAVLENLVHWQSTTLPPTLVCVVARVPCDVSQADASELDVHDVDACRALGNAWFDAGKTCALWVPSVVSPYESNVLINQRHADFELIDVAAPVATAIDQRLVRPRTA